MWLAHRIAYTGCGENMSFEDGYAFIYSRIDKQKFQNIEGKITKEDIINAIEDETLTLDEKVLENSNDLYIVLKDR